MATKEEEYRRLRRLLNKAIRGPNTDAVLSSVAPGLVHLIDNVEAVNDSLYIVSAQGKFLDARLGDRGVTRPSQVGLSDDVFREIGIEITNRKQVRDLIHQILRILYGEVFTRATSQSTEVENYALQDGDNLVISFDDADAIEIVFDTTQFASINNATAQEVADAITKSIRKLGKTGAAFAESDGVDTRVVLISSTDGPSSSIKVLGGSAQNVLKFSEIRPTSGDATTQWTITQEPSGALRATWSGGTDPFVSRVKAGDYISIYGSAFDDSNKGSFTITAVEGGSVGNAYIEYDNPNGTPEIQAQGTDEGVLFYNPQRLSLISKDRYAAAFQTTPRNLEIYIPATTKVVRRDRTGAAHIYESGASNVGQEGPYLFDPSRGFTIGEESATTTEEVNVSSDSILEVDDSSEFPDSEGNLILGFGTSREEGPIPYIARPSTGTLRINPAYQFTNEHPVGTNVTLVSQNSPPEPSQDGEDYPFYLTDSVAGRIYSEELIQEITATGIVVTIVVLYPNDIGLGKAGDETNSEKYYIWGTEDDL